MIRHDHIIEVRMLLERGRLLQNMKNLTEHTGLVFQNVMHFTLVYDFAPLVHPSKIMSTVREVSLRYDSLDFWINGFEVKSTKQGHVFAFKVEPSRDLVEFRRELYDSVKGMINERDFARKYNTEKDFWFHVSIATRLQDYKEKIIKDTIRGQQAARSLRGKSQSVIHRTVRSVEFPSEIVLITLINQRRIGREYDRLTDTILDRRQALSYTTRRNTLEKIRKMHGIEKTLNHTGPGQTWVISDTHFDHENIIGYTGRPFLNVEEMNRIIESNWNNTVHNGDRVYFLGDMVFGRGSRSKEYWLGRLNGHIEYIRGNHDTEHGTESHAVISHKDHDLLLVHNPNSLPIKWDGWIIHGDKHNNSLKKYPLIDTRKKTANVCAELIKYTPINLDKMIELINAKADRAVL